MRSYYAKNSGARIPHPVAPSAWNPLDIISSQAIPTCLGLTEANRVATRNTVMPNEWEAGVRGVQSRGGVIGERWYLELEVLSIGDGSASANQGMQIGLIDARATNVLSRPPASSNSVITNLISPVSHYALCYSRLDGIVFTDVNPPGGAGPGNFVTQMAIGDIFGFDWLVGTSITIKRNNAGTIVASYPSFTGQLFPFFSAGATVVDASNFGSTESCRIRTGRSQQSYRPVGATAWG